MNDFALKNNVIQLQRMLPAELGYHVLDECNYVKPISSENYLSSFVKPMNSRVSIVMADKTIDGQEGDIGPPKIAPFEKDCPDQIRYCMASIGTLQRQSSPKERVTCRYI